jgi:site-specific recombinase XerD
MNTLPTVRLSKFTYNGTLQIAIRFSFNTTIKSKLKEIPFLRWSSSQRCWYIEHSKANLELIILKLKHIALIDTTELLGSMDQNLPLLKQKRILDDSQRTLLNSFYKYLKGKRYSKSTITTYTNYIADFISFHRDRALKDLSNRDVELFIESVFIKRNYSISSQRQFISAMKLFIVFEPITEIKDLELVRPKKSRQLPTVLSQQEVISIIAKTKNLKHRAILALTYSCGLRISEVLNLRIVDIDTDRMQVFIKNSKGRKDRYVGLAESFLPLLSNYFTTYEPKYYFIEGSNNKKYSSQSVRAFLKKSCGLAGIKKNVTPHTLRHSYATHLLENGVNLRYIQTLLGHSKPETTMIYTKVMQTNLMAIENPLDNAIRKLKQLDKDHKKVGLSRNI